MGYNSVVYKTIDQFIDDYINCVYIPRTEADIQGYLFALCLKELMLNRLDLDIHLNYPNPYLDNQKHKKIDIVIGTKVAVEIKFEADYTGVSKPVVFPKDAMEYFSHASRKEYFDGIDSSFLHNAVILIDPDTGFEVKNMNQRKRYLRFSDLKQVFDRAENSLVVVHQHIPRKKRLPYFTEIANRIKDWLDVDQCICISDNEIVFFVIATSGLM